QLVDRMGKVETHPFDRVPQQFSLAYVDMLPPMVLVFISVREARGGPRGRGWTVVTPGVPIAARRVVRAQVRVDAPQEPLLWIAVGLAHSSDDPIDIDSESEEFIRGETEEDTDNME
ncbi:hypothetical protein KI387_019649, partial [Taxus chinensis]